MLSIGYEQKDGSVKYLYTNDDSFENVLSLVVYSDIPLPDKPYGGDELKETHTIHEYFAEKLSEEEDTRFRFLRRKDETWLIRDFYAYGTVEHDIIIRKAIKGGSKPGKN